MYQPPQFVAEERAQALMLMRGYPLASLDESGGPFVSHLPLLLEERGDELVLLGHWPIGW